jgi:hypothetical protein
MIAFHPWQTGRRSTVQGLETVATGYAGFGRDQTAKRGDGCVDQRLTRRATGFVDEVIE